MYSGNEHMQTRFHTMSAVALLKQASLPESVLKDSFEFIAAVRRGVPGSLLKNMVAEFGERELFAELMDTTPPNLSRLYKQQHLSRIKSENALDTLRVFELAESVFDTPELGREWMHMPIPALGGVEPVQLCDTFVGREMVMKTLRAIDYGEFC